MAEQRSFVVATEAAPRNWLHGADIIIADADIEAVAARLAEELLRRYPGAQAVCVLVRGGQS
jgi:outer membrane cobalamin receptor